MKAPPSMAQAANARAEILKTLETPMVQAALQKCEAAFGFLKPFVSLGWGENCAMLGRWPFLAGRGQLAARHRRPMAFQSTFPSRVAAQAAMEIWNGFDISTPSPYGERPCLRVA